MDTTRSAAMRYLTQNVNLLYVFNLELLFAILDKRDLIENARGFVKRTARRSKKKDPIDHFTVVGLVS